MRKSVFAFVCLLVLFAGPPLLFAQPLYVMSYNVENLWDAENGYYWQDESSGETYFEPQGDPTYLPKAEKEAGGLCDSVDAPWRGLCTRLDWTDSRYRRKLKAAASVILDSNEGLGPDILILLEIENRPVVEDLYRILAENDRNWPAYSQIIHFESEGHRRIDVAMISRYPLIDPNAAQAHIVDFNGDGHGDSRDILEATFDVNGAAVRIVANHWPSQLGSNSNEQRIFAAKILRSIALKAAREGVPLVAMGDFNTLESETPNPVHDVVASDRPLKKNPLVDLQPYSQYDSWPPTSYYYSRNRVWNSLDRILVSKDLVEGSGAVRLSETPFEIVAMPYLFKGEGCTAHFPGSSLQEMVRSLTRLLDAHASTNEAKPCIPFRYDFFRSQGYSDHLPVAVRLQVD